jgi:uncharacterized protein
MHFKLLQMSFALVTGASKGIGKSISDELAKLGFDLLLVARSQELLAEQATKLMELHAIQVKYLAIDLSKVSAARDIFEWCLQNNYPVTILVNNAGYGLSGPFDRFSLDENLNMMQLNMQALVELCYLFLPAFKKSEKSYILNIASSAAYQAVPFLSLYSATKAFVLSFSRGLRQELRKSAVSVTCVCPGATDTEFTVRAKIGQKGLKAAAKMNMTPEAVAKQAVSAMLSGKAELVTGLINKIGAFMTRVLPKGIIEKTAMSIYE